ncbi:hypothetical protein ETU10_08625 [Apibacter muscae]|uniref:hypothetical protein n=1 Tax=Apibacter muscae TaxID=2509004 RepID=UPI0011ACC148|nr:hypothetical protein [Apibacter muscae]TWP23150.1 hypothetical protein ETU10_08625 [Apibacter muscae]
MDALKILIITFVCAIIGYLEPINNSILVLIILFCWDMSMGILVDLVVNKDRMRIKKLLISLLFVALYTLIIASLFIIGRLMDDVEEFLEMIKILTYVCAYFYGSNALRNLTILFPNNKTFSFLYEFLGLQIVKRIPELSSFLLKKREEKNENNPLKSNNN